MTRYITLAEYLVITELATGFAAEDLAATGRIDLADSALHAPQAGFEDQDFYPDVYDKAAVLCWRLARNHPLAKHLRRAHNMPRTSANRDRNRGPAVRL